MCSCVVGVSDTGVQGMCPLHLMLLLRLPRRHRRSRPLSPVSTAAATAPDVSPAKPSRGKSRVAIKQINKLCALEHNTVYNVLVFS